jgi:hypothetical protein
MPAASPIPSAIKAVGPFRTLRVHTETKIDGISQKERGYPQKGDLIFPSSSRQRQFV